MAIRLVGLLRGINVGGNGLLKMADLRACVERAGYQDVSTFIASGNVLFTAARSGKPAIERALTSALDEAFSMPILVTVRDAKELDATIEAIPRAWLRSADAWRVNVAFLDRGVDPQTAADSLSPKAGVDELAAAPGALILATRKAQIARTGFTKIVGSPFYKRLTIRGLSTTLKLQALLSDRGG